MKHLRKFENWDMGSRFGEETNPYMPMEKDQEEECAPCNTDPEYDEVEENEEEYVPSSSYSFDSQEDETEVKDWNDDEELRLERVVSFHQFESKKNSKGKTPKTEKEKELAAKYPPKNKITKGDFIAAAIENKKGGKGNNNKEEEKDNKKEDDKKPKFGSKEWREKYAKKK